MPIPTRDDAAVLFLDLQDEIVVHSKTLPLDRLRLAAGVLARLAALHKLPAFLSAVPPGGPYLDDVLAPLGGPTPSLRSGPTPSLRTATTAFADDGLVAALRASGRRNLILAGVASEIVVQRTALDALAAGYGVLVAVDACGGIDARTEAAAWQRITAAGGAVTSVITTVAEMTGDFTTEAGQASLGLMYELIGG